MKKILFFLIASIVVMFVIGGCDKHKTYDVVFDANGGSGIMQSQTFTEGESQTLDDNSFVNEGRVFGGWNTLPDGSGISYSNGQVLTLASDITLYAQWSGGDMDPETFGFLNGHEWIDLGLPSGTKWASCNVGAKDYEGYGDYFAWGETSTKEIYNWSTYIYCNGSYNTLTKYCSKARFGYNGFTDRLTTLEAIDDAATANWGEGWRIPTNEEMRELYLGCTYVWTTLNGVNGLKFTGPNGNSIFLPAAGIRNESSLELDGTDGAYWTKSLTTNWPCCSWYLCFVSYSCYTDDGLYHYAGVPVRAVVAK